MILQKPCGDRFGDIISPRHWREEPTYRVPHSEVIECRVQEFHDSLTPIITVDVWVSCSREESYCFQYVRKSRFFDESGFLESVIGVGVERENGPRDGREIGIHCSFDNGKVLRVECRDDAAIRRVAK